jgi:hypothetical protein
MPAADEAKRPAAGWATAAPTLEGIAGTITLP